MAGGNQRKTFEAERRGVMRGTVAAAATLIAVGVVVWLAPAALVLDGALDTRLRVGAAAALVPAVAVALEVVAIANFRLRSPEAIDGAASDRPGSPLRVRKAVLANSVEQAVIAVPTYLLLALVLSPERLFAVPALAVLYAIGRVSFARRYRAGAAARSYGFALTFAPTMAGLAAAVALVLS